MLTRSDPPAAKQRPPEMGRTLKDAPPPVAPEALQRKLFDLADDFGGEVGIAIYDLKNGWLAGVDADRPYPQQSASKVWVAIALLQAVDQGRLSLSDRLMMSDEHRSVFFQPIVGRMGRTGFETTIDQLLDYAIKLSDNAANDRLMGLVGGPEAVDSALRQMGLQGVQVADFERNLQAKTAGLVWRYDYGFGYRFQEARAALPREVRDAAAKNYLEAPMDGVSPRDFVGGLAALKRGELLSPEMTHRLLDAMATSVNGPRRLKGGVPSDWYVAHKTGTGQDWGGGAMGINDVAILTAPDGHDYAVAVMIRHARRPVGDRLAFMQSVSRAVVDNWQAETYPQIAELPAA